MPSTTAEPVVRGALLDLSGVLYVGDQALPGAVAAVERLQAAGLPLRYITNTSRSTRSAIHAKLRRMGFRIPTRHIFTAPLATCFHLERHHLRPYLVVHPNLAAEFSALPQDHPNAVVLGDAGEAFTYDRLNRAFRLLMDGAEFLAMGDNRYFREADGLSLDLGPFVRALEYASGRQATILGKPAAGFFHAAVADLGLSPAEVVMVGDDAHSDVEGALAAGLQAILVRTGKYRPGDEARIGLPGARVMDDIVAVADWLLRHFPAPNAQE